MRGLKGSRTLLLLPMLLLAACDRGPGRDTVATAGDFRLGVDEAAQLVAPVHELPNDEGVMEAVAQFWTDYSLLAWAVNQEGEMDRLDFSPLIDQHVSQTLIMRLRDAVIQVDTEIPDEELREIFEREQPGDEVRARHVLLRFPEGATPAQRDSVQALAEDIRDRARAGSDFSALAQEYSEDPGSAPTGGDLGFFGRGMMVPPFEDAAFALSPGEVSDVVTSDFGLHVIRLEERRSPAFEDVAEEYRAQMEWELTVEAESLFLQQIEGAANVQVQEDAPGIVREVAARADGNISNRLAGRDLATFQGGSYTAGDLRDFLMGQPVYLREQIDGALDEHLEEFVMDLTRDRLLVAEAERRGIVVDAAERERLETEIREEYRLVAEYLGLDAIQPASGERLRSAVDREVKELMALLIRGERELAPLEGLSLPLRARYGAELSEAGIQRAIARSEELRAEGFTGPDRTGPLPAPAPTPAPEATPTPEADPAPEVTPPAEPGNP